jgi:hypothetical protein
MGGPPNTDPGGDYNYRAAWVGDAVPAMDPASGEFHGQSYAEIPPYKPIALKSEDHPTQWKGEFMTQFGVNPDMLQEGQVTPEMEQFMQGEVEKHLISQALMGMPNDSVGQEQTLRPLNAGEFRQNPDGSKSSELSMTVQMGDKWTNIPSLWMTPDGVQELDQGAAMEAAQQYMEQTGKAFPTFETVDDAVGAAQKRSLAGAVSHGALAR